VESEAAKKILQPPPVVKAEKGGVEIMDRLAEEWRQLCNEGPSDQPFYRPEWVRAYVCAFVPQQKLLVITARSGGRLRAVLPFVEERSFFCGFPVRKLRGTANVHSLRFDIVRGAAAEGEAAVLAVWSFLKELPGWDLLELPYVPQGAALEQLFRAAQIDGFLTGYREEWRSPFIPLSGYDGTKDWWLACADTKFRANLRRRMRNLKAQGPLLVRRFDRADPSVLQCFYDLERSGWKGQERSAIACDPSTRQFYDQIARGAAQFGYLSLYFLESNGRAVAAHFGLSHRGRYFVPKLAYDEKYKQYGPGHLLVRAVLNDCAQRGLIEFDFCAAWEEWKGEWTSKVRRHTDWYVFRKGLLGRVLHTMKFRAKASLKGILGEKVVAVLRKLREGMVEKGEG